MQYTDSDAYVTHGGTGHRMHQDSAPIPTVLSAKDANMVIWSLMKVLEAGGVAGATFDPSNPATYDRLLKAIRAVGVQPGAVVPYATAAAPEGYLLCDGSAVSRTTYAALFAAVGTIWGAGDGSTTFNLPEGRAEYLRGADAARLIDPTLTVGSWHNHMLASHTHDLKVFSRNLSSDGSEEGDDSVSTSETPVAGLISATGGTETRPRSIVVLWCIKT